MNINVMKLALMNTMLRGVNAKSVKLDVKNVPQIKTAKFVLAYLIFMIAIVKQIVQLYIMFHRGCVINVQIH